MVHPGEPGKDETSAPHAPAASGDRNPEGSAGAHWRGPAAVPWRPERPAPDLRQHTERCSAPHGLHQGRCDGARLPGHCVDLVERKWPVEPRRDRTAARPFGGKRRPPGLRPRRTLGRASADDAVVGRLPRRSTPGGFDLRLAVAMIISISPLERGMNVGRRYPTVPALILAESVGRPKNQRFLGCARPKRGRNCRT